MITPRAVPALLPAHHRRVASYQAITKMTLPTPWINTQAVTSITSGGHLLREPERMCGWPPLSGRSRPVIPVSSTVPEN
jgi:hypothetical protein